MAIPTRRLGSSQKTYSARAKNKTIPAAAAAAAAANKVVVDKKGKGRALESKDDGDDDVVLVPAKRKGKAARTSQQHLPTPDNSQSPVRSEDEFIPRYREDSSNSDESEEDSDEDQYIPTRLSYSSQRKAVAASVRKAKGKAAASRNTRIPQPRAISARGKVTPKRDVFDSEDESEQDHQERVPTRPTALPIRMSRQQNPPQRTPSNSAPGKKMGPPATALAASSAMKSSARRGRTASKAPISAVKPIAMKTIVLSSPPRPRGDDYASSSDSDSDFLLKSSSVTRSKRKAPAGEFEWDERSRSCVAKRERSRSRSAALHLATKTQRSLEETRLSDTFHQDRDDMPEERDLGEGCSYRVLHTEASNTDMLKGLEREPAPVVTPYLPPPSAHEDIEMDHLHDDADQVPFEDNDFAPDPMGWSPLRLDETPIYDFTNGGLPEDSSEAEDGLPANEQVQQGNEADSEDEFFAQSIQHVPPTDLPPEEDSQLVEAPPDQRPKALKEEVDEDQERSALSAPSDGENSRMEMDQDGEQLHPLRNIGTRHALPVLHTLPNLSLHPRSAPAPVLTPIKIEAAQAMPMSVPDILTPSRLPPLDEVSSRMSQVFARLNATSSPAASTVARESSVLPPSSPPPLPEPRSPVGRNHLLQDIIDSTSDLSEVESVKEEGRIQAKEPVGMDYEVDPQDRTVRTQDSLRSTENAPAAGDLPVKPHQGPFNSAPALSHPPTVEAAQNYATSPQPGPTPTRTLRPFSSRINTPRGTSSAAARHASASARSTPIARPPTRSQARRGSVVSASADAVSPSSPASPKTATDDIQPTASMGTAAKRSHSPQPPPTIALLQEDLSVTYEGAPSRDEKHIRRTTELLILQPNASQLHPPHIRSPSPARGISPLRHSPLVTNGSYARSVSTTPPRQRTLSPFAPPVLAKLLSSPRRTPANAEQYETAPTSTTRPSSSPSPPRDATINVMTSTPAASRIRERTTTPLLERIRAFSQEVARRSSAGPTIPSSIKEEDIEQVPARAADVVTVPTLAAQTPDLGAPGTEVPLNGEHTSQPPSSDDRQQETPPSPEAVQSPTTGTQQSKTPKHRTGLPSPAVRSLMPLDSPVISPNVTVRKPRSGSARSSQSPQKQNASSRSSAVPRALSFTQLGALDSSPISVAASIGRKSFEALDTSSEEADSDEEVEGLVRPSPSKQLAAQQVEKAARLRYTSVLTSSDDGMDEEAPTSAYNTSSPKMQSSSDQHGSPTGSGGEPPVTSTPARMFGDLVLSSVQRLALPSRLFTTSTPSAKRTTAPTNGVTLSPSSSQSPDSPAPNNPTSPRLEAVSEGDVEAGDDSLFVEAGSYAEGQSEDELDELEVVVRPKSADIEPKQEDEGAMQAEEADSCSFEASDGPSKMDGNDISGREDEADDCDEEEAAENNSSMVLNEARPRSDLVAPPIGSSKRPAPARRGSRVVKIVTVRPPEDVDSQAGGLADQDSDSSSSSVPEIRNRSHSVLSRQSSAVSNTSNVVQVSSADPMAAARAAAILKVHHQYIQDGHWPAGISPSPPIAARSASEDGERVLDELLREAELEVSTMRAAEQSAVGEISAEVSTDVEESKLGNISAARVIRQPPSRLGIWTKHDWRELEQCFIDERRRTNRLREELDPKEVVKLYLESQQMTAEDCVGEWDVDKLEIRVEALCCRKAAKASEERSRRERSASVLSSAHSRAPSEFFHEQDRSIGRPDRNSIGESPEHTFLQVPGHLPNVRRYAASAEPLEPDKKDDFSPFHRVGSKSPQAPPSTLYNGGTRLHRRASSLTSIAESPHKKVSPSYTRPVGKPSSIANRISKLYPSLDELSVEMRRKKNMPIRGRSIAAAVTRIEKIEEENIKDAFRSKVQKRKAEELDGSTNGSVDGASDEQNKKQKVASS